MGLPIESSKSNISAFLLDSIMQAAQNQFLKFAIVTSNGIIALLRPDTKLGKSTLIDEKQKQNKQAKIKPHPAAYSSGYYVSYNYLFQPKLYEHSRFKAVLNSDDNPKVDNSFTNFYKDTRKQ